MSSENALQPTAVECLARIREILAESRSRAHRAVNAAMLGAYWHIGREIVEEEQRGKERADYGMHLIQQLSDRLTDEFGRGYSVGNLRPIRQFHLTYKDRAMQTRDSVNRELGDGGEIRYSVSSELQLHGRQGVAPQLTFTHYRHLMKVMDPSARDFYEVECAKAGWSVRQLQRQINTLLYERLAKSRDKEGVMALAQEGQEVRKPEDFIKDPYVLEFAGLPEAAKWQESDLEAALLDRLQEFLLELGRDLFFVARQQRITLEGEHFHIDLVFYHRVLRCFLLIDLKVERLCHADIGQMLTYTGYYEQEEMREDENPPIGLILCTDSNEAIVKYALSKTASQVFASRYQLHLPSERELEEELKRERQRLDQQLPLPDEQ